MSSQPSLRSYKKYTIIRNVINLTFKDHNLLDKIENAINKMSIEYDKLICKSPDFNMPIFNYEINCKLSSNISKILLHNHIKFTTIRYCCLLRRKTVLYLGEFIDKNNKINIKINDFSNANKITSSPITIKNTKTYQ